MNETDVQKAATEAVGVLTIWLRRIRIGYDIFSIIAFTVLVFYFYAVHKQAKAATAEIQAAHVREQNAMSQLSILQTEGKAIQYIVRTNLVYVQNSEIKINETESNMRGVSDWRKALRFYTN